MSLKTEFRTAAALYVYISNIREGIREFQVNPSLQSSKDEILAKINNLVNPILDTEFSEFMDSPNKEMKDILKEVNPFIIDFFRLINGKTPEQITHNYENLVYKHTNYKGDVKLVSRDKDTKEDLINCLIKRESIELCRPTKLEQIALLACGQILEIGTLGEEPYIKYD